MLELIISIIFIISLGGVLFILAKKIPVLNTLPQKGSTGIKKHKIILDVENWAKSILLALEKKIWLHKLLSWVKIMTLKLETRIDHLLHKLRKKAQEVDKELKKKSK